MNLSDFVNENRKKIKYDMRNINGGFSDGVEIRPAQNDPAIMNITINIYGGSKNSFNAYKVPPRIQELQSAFLKTRQTGDPFAAEFKKELDAYYDNLKRAIGLEMVRLIQEFDAQAKDSIGRAIGKLNQRYQQ